MDMSVHLSDGKGSISMIHDTPPLQPSNGPPPPHLSTNSQEGHHQHLSIIPYTSKKGVVVHYRECLKNHAASTGGNATDGCGEFMPSGEEALKCSACGCHRSFHRRETEGDASFPDCYHNQQLEGVLISRPEAFGYSNSAARTPPPMIMPLNCGHIDISRAPLPPVLKKRSRTKFSAEQKEKMIQFAEKVGWRMPKQGESSVQQLCEEIGVKRRVLKVWMYNNKHNLAKKSSSSVPTLSPLFISDSSLEV